MILGELHAHLLHLRGAKDARRAVAELLDDPVHDWIEVGPGLLRTALTDWLGRFADQEFTLVDAVSFELMRGLGVTKAFAFDRHFEVAGFTLLR
jgi:predicted nucleic acid-binding protein